MPCEKQNRGRNLIMQNKIHSRTYRATVTHGGKIRRGLLPITKATGAGRAGPPPNHHRRLLAPSLLMDRPCELTDTRTPGRTIYKLRKESFFKNNMFIEEIV
jgi:hypothetical protein